ncbi:U8 snoRNA-decapping enzyme [Orchesella cincta]|uniref:U8 snoRNA-decapping enzyme n=1 Tax=Orchesella cincta TaxID=48709 RepID=A0A1D2M9Q6_ORCCI|nr:U8 snoRNA-decapping enzyme [Orchesella cincta]
MDGTRGRDLPNFLTSSFIGNSMEQLLRGILKLGFLTKIEVKDAYKVAFQNIKKRHGGTGSLQFKASPSFLFN